MASKLQIGSSNKRDEFQDDPASKDLNGYVQNLLKQMQDRFDDMSENIVGRINDMSSRIKDIEDSVSSLMNELDLDDNNQNKQ